MGRNESRSEEYLYDDFGNPVYDDQGNHAMGFRIDSWYEHKALSQWKSLGHQYAQPSMSFELPILGIVVMRTRLSFRYRAGNWLS